MIVFIVASHGSLTYFCICLSYWEIPKYINIIFLPLDGQYGEAEMHMFGIVG
jgi:hypothetical protein